MMPLAPPLLVLLPVHARSVGFLSNVFKLTTVRPAGLQITQNTNRTRPTAFTVVVSTRGVYPLEVLSEPSALRRMFVQAKRADGRI